MIDETTDDKRRDDKTIAKDNVNNADYTHKNYDILRGVWAGWVARRQGKGGNE